MWIEFKYVLLGTHPVKAELWKAGENTLKILKNSDTSKTTIYPVCFGTPLIFAKIIIFQGCKFWDI